jgi:hypothetical protein
MMDCDLAYVARLINSGVIHGRVLELGGGYGGATCSDLIKDAGMEYLSTDLPGCPNRVDHEIDFLAAEFSHSISEGFDAILILNVLEHVFDPVMLLDRAITLLRPQGAIVLISPVIWPIHHYPIDCLRLLPDFYREYAHRRGMTIAKGTFQYISSKTPLPHKTPENECLPRIQASSPLRSKWSRIIHRIFSTDGRLVYTLPVSLEAIGVALQKS